MEPTEEEHDYIRQYGEPSGPEDGPGRRVSLRESRGFQYFTFIVGVFSAFWIMAVNWLNMNPSKVTYTVFLGALIFYSGEYNNWRIPSIVRRSHRRHRASWRDR